MEIFLPDWHKFDEMAASPPTGRVMLFLRRQPDTKEPLYRIVNVAEGYFYEAPGVEPAYGADEPWLEELHATRFADLVAKVQAVKP